MIRSDGSFVRDYFYVEDAAHAYLTLAENLAGRRELAGEAFNFSSGCPLTVLDLVRWSLPQPVDRTCVPTCAATPATRFRNSTSIRARHVKFCIGNRALRWTKA